MVTSGKTVVFYGEVSVNLDAKGRIAIPTRFREQIATECGNQLVLTYNAHDNNSLWLYPMDVWAQMRDQVMALNAFDERHRTLQRRLVGSAAPMEPDGSSRLLLPVTLREVAGLEKKVTFMGMGRKFEIWNEEVLNRTRFDAPVQAPSEEMLQIEV